MINRKIVKIILDKCIGSNFQTFSTAEERHSLDKLKTCVSKNQASFEAELEKYDEMDSGEITTEDLKEVFIVFDLYTPGSKMFECLSLMWLRLNGKSTTNKV